MNNHQNSRWTREFQNFVTASEVSPPANLFDTIVTRVHGDLSPAIWRVLSKLAVIHLVVGTATILICPQFGFHLTSGMGLMALFMRLGEQGCMMACGAVFMGGSALVGAVILRPEEVRVIRRTRFLQISTLALLSMGAFVCAGVGMMFSLSLFWLMGSVIGGLLSLELGWILRFGKRRVRLT